MLDLSITIEFEGRNSVPCLGDIKQIVTTSHINSVQRFASDKYIL